MLGRRGWRYSRFPGLLKNAEKETDRMGQLSVRCSWPDKEMCPARLKTLQDFERFGRVARKLPVKWECNGRNAFRTREQAFRQTGKNSPSRCHQRTQMAAEHTEFRGRKQSSCLRQSTLSGRVENHPVLWKTLPESRICEHHTASSLKLNSTS